MDSVAGAANNATNALSDYLKKLQQSTFKTELTNKLIGNYGFDPERAKAFAEAYVQNGNKISARDAKIIDQNLAANRKLKQVRRQLPKLDVIVQQLHVKQIEKPQKRRMKLKDCLKNKLDYVINLQIVTLLN